MVLCERDGQKFFDDQLLSHIRNKEHDNVQAILENVDVKDLVESSGMALLHYAVKANGLTTVKYLIERGCEIDAVDTNGNTPLLQVMNVYRCRSLSIRWDIVYPLDLKIIEVLLEADADVLYRGQGNENALQIALLLQHYWSGKITTMIFQALKRKYSSDQQQMAKILLDVKCSLPQAMNWYSRDSVVTEYMLDAGCDIHERDPKDNFTALHYAVEKLDINNVKLLIQRGADVFATDEKECRPFDYYSAGKDESYEMLITILSHDTWVNASNIAHSRLARKVLSDGHLNEVEELLIRYNFDFEDTTCSGHGETLLHSISKNMNPGVIHLLEGRKIDVHAKDRLYGGTALASTVYYGNIDCIKLLLKRGADPNDTFEDEDGKYTVFSYGFDVWMTGDVNISLENCVKGVELFLEYGANILCENDQVITVFDSYLIYRSDYNFPIIQPIIAELSMMEATGKEIDDYIPRKLKNDKYYKENFKLCKHKTNELKEMWINNKVTLFQFLTEPEEKLLKYVRNDESAKRLQQIILKERHSDISFMKRLIKRIDSILETAKFRKEAALVISRISGCSNEDVIEMIVLLLDKQSLQNLCQV